MEIILDRLLIVFLEKDFTFLVSLGRIIGDGYFW